MAHILLQTLVLAATRDAVAHPELSGAQHTESMQAANCVIKEDFMTSIASQETSFGDVGMPPAC